MSKKTWHVIDWLDIYIRKYKALGRYGGQQVRTEARKYLGDNDWMFFNGIVKQYLREVAERG